MKKRNVTFLKLGIFIIIPLVVFQTGCSQNNLEIPITTKSDEAREIFLKALDFSENFDQDKARSLFTQAIEKDEEFALAYMHRALNSTTSDNEKKDMEQGMFLSSLVSEGERLQIEAIYAYWIENKREKWAELNKEIVKKYPRDKRAHFYMGNAYRFYYNDYDNAIAELEQAIAIDNDYAAPYNLLGYTFMAKEEYENAERAFKDYIRLIPNHANPHDSMADLLSKMGRYQEAITFYQKALELDPTFIVSQQKIGVNLFFLEKYDKGRDAFRTSIKIATTPGGKITSMRGIARSYIYEGNYKMALTEIDNAIQVAIDLNLPRREIYCLLVKSTILIEMDNFDQAVSIVSKCKERINTVDILPYYKTTYLYYALWNEAMIAAERDEFSKAIDFADQIKTKIESTNDTKAMADRYYPLMGYIHLEEQKYRKAIEYFEQANPENSWTLYCQAIAESKLGNKDKASVLLKKVANWNEDGLDYALIRSKAKAGLLD